MQQDQKDKFWRIRTVSPLRGKTLLVVGLGNTGQAVAKMAKAFGMTVIGTRSRPVQMDNVDEVHGADQLLTLVPRADFIAVCTPLTAQTRGLLGPAEIAAMGKHVVITDVSRGGVIEPATLLEALQNNTIAGAALDVFETEPLPETSPFWTLDNVLLSPHCSAVHGDWEQASFDLFKRNLRHFISGEDLFNIVDPSRGY